MEKYMILDRPLFGGVQKMYKFENGYGASVVRHMGSYGREQNLWELAVLAFDEDDWHLCYSTEITDDVIGHLTWDEVEELLGRIKELEPSI